LSFTEQRSLAGGSIAKSLSALRTAVTRLRVRVHGFGVHDRLSDRSRDRFCIRFYLCLFPDKNREAVIERTVESSVTELMAGQMTRLRYRLPKSRWVLCVHRDGRSYCFLRDTRCMPVQSRYNYRHLYKRSQSFALPSSRLVCRFSRMRPARSLSSYPDGTFLPCLLAGLMRLTDL